MKTKTNHGRKAISNPIEELNLEAKLVPYLKNDFVDMERCHGDELAYTKDFYIALYHRMKEEHMTAAQAYESLGFDTKVLGKDRANSAARRAKKMAEEGKLDFEDPGCYDGSVKLEQMGNLSPQEKIAYLEARTHYLETFIDLQKKTLSVLGEKKS